VYSCGHAPKDVADSSCTASYTFAGDANHEGSSDSKTYTIRKAASTTTVTVAGGPDFTYDGNEHPATVSVTGAGGLNLTPAPVYSCGHVPKDVADSGCVASYTYAGDANHDGSSDSKTYTIRKAASTTAVTVAGGESFTYDGNEHPAAVAVTGAGGLNLTPAPVYSCGHVPKDVADSGCVASYTYAGDANHDGSSGSKTYTISKANAVIAVNGYTGVYDGNSHGATGSATGVKGENMNASLNLGSTFTNVPGGTASWAFTGGANYKDVNGSVAIVINKATATISVTPYNVIFDGNAHTATGTATGVKSESLSGLNLAGTTHTTVGNYNDTWIFTDITGNYNNASGSVTDIIQSWRLTGFYQPVDMNDVYNVVKNGSTVPLKFEIFAGPTELTSTGSVEYLRYGETNCSAIAPTDEIETTATGGTVLRYDTTGGQFIYNWKTPSTAGKCYRVTMMTQDGSSLIAYFKLK
jgi:hypothetical protein